MHNPRHTMANVAFESVSRKSEAASRLACSNSRRFFFRFSRWMSTARSAVGGDGGWVFRVGMEVRQKEFTCPQGMRTQTFTQRGFGHRASGAHIPGYQDPVGVRHPHNTHARDADAQQRRGGRYAFALRELIVG